MSWLWAMLVQLGTLAAPIAPPSDEVIVHVREADGTAGATLADLVASNGAAELPPIRIEVPELGSRLTAARERCSVPTRPIAVFWLDVARTDEWRLYALPCAAQQPFVREIPVGVGEEQASIETLWLIVRSSATAIAAGGEPAMQAIDPEAIEPKPVTEPKPTAPPQPPTVLAPEPVPEQRKLLRASIGYAGDGLARTVPWQSGVIAAFSVAPRSWLRVGTSYEFLAHARRDEPSGFALWRHGLALTLAGVIPLAKRVDLELRLGGELELSRWRSDATGRGRLRAIPRVGFDALLQIELGRGVSIDVGPGLAVALLDVDFVTCAQGAATCAGASRRVVVDTWRVRPRARAGISVQF